MAFRFVHTADLHLDSPLRSLALRDPALAARVGQATRRAFERTVELCLEREVHALMIAGDLFDGEQHSMKTALFFGQQLRRLVRAGIQVFIVRGNHDARSQITRHLPLPPEGVQVFSGRGECHLLAEGQVAVHGVSFREPKAPDSLLPKYKAPVPGAFNIGLLHTSLGGAPGHDTYAPCSLAELKAQGFQYWCLGHIHKREVHAQEAGFCAVMPGIPQGRHINEAGSKSVTYVELAPDGSVSLEACETSSVIFERLRVDVAGYESTDALLSALEAKLSEAPATARILRLELHGETPLYAQLLRERERLLGALRALDTVGLEGLDVRCTAPSTHALDADQLRALAPLAQEVIAEPSFAHWADELVQGLAAQLPPEIRHRFAEDEDLRAAASQEGLAELQARLDAEAP